ncbi:hypothetical protein PENTCL1PPCAC_4661, partial [Pristionchus entomophagus]
TVAMYRSETDHWETDGLADFTLCNRSLIVFGLPAPVSLPKESFSTPYAGNMALAGGCFSVYVGNLSLETTEDDVGQLLS